MTEGPPVAYNQKAKELHEEILVELELLLALDAPSCLDESFKNAYFKIVEIYDRYQKEVLAGSELSAACSEGCSCCCCHWVDDVYSFEAEIIADYIRLNFPEKIPSFIKYLQEDEAQLAYLDKMLKEKMVEDHEGEDLDERELLLSCFYILKRPCMLVDDRGACSVYPVRPLTCRIFVSLGEPEKCNPDHIDLEEAETCILDLDSRGDALLEKLHKHYDRFHDERGLRALLLQILK